MFGKNKWSNTQRISKELKGKERFIQPITNNNVTTIKIENPIQMFGNVLNPA